MAVFSWWNHIYYHRPFYMLLSLHPRPEMIYLLLVGLYSVKLCFKGIIFEPFDMSNALIVNLGGGGGGGGGGWSGVAMLSCIVGHRGVQMILAYSWARPAILVADKSRGGMVSFLFFFLPAPSLSSPLLSLLPFSGRRYKMAHKGWCVVKPQYNQSIKNYYYQYYYYYLYNNFFLCFFFFFFLRLLFAAWKEVRLIIVLFCSFPFYSVP